MDNRTNEGAMEGLGPLGAGAGFKQGDVVVMDNPRLPHYGEQACIVDVYAAWGDHVHMWIVRTFGAVSCLRAPSDLRYPDSRLEVMAYDAKRRLLAEALELAQVHLGPYDETNDPHFDAGLEYAEERLETAARGYIEAIDRIRRNQA